MMKQSHGFTILELIATLVLLGIMMVMIVPYMNSGITKSSLATNELRESLDLRAVMANIIADYEANYRTDLSGLQSQLDTNSAQYLDGAPTQSTLIVDSSPVKIDATDSKNSLLVTITGSNAGESLTMLFTEK